MTTCSEAAPAVVCWSCGPVAPVLAWDWAGRWEEAPPDGTVVLVAVCPAYYHHIGIVDEQRFGRFAPRRPTQRRGKRAWS
jgi:hypothetical protein